LKCFECWGLRLALWLLSENNDSSGDKKRVAFFYLSFISFTHTHTHLSPCTHTYTHTHMPPCTHTYIYTHSLVPMNTHSLVPMYTHIHMYTHVHLHPYIHSHTHTCTQSTHTYFYSKTQTHTHTHVHMLLSSHMKKTTNDDHIQHHDNFDGVFIWKTFNPAQQLNNPL